MSVERSEFDVQRSAPKGAVFYLAWTGEKDKALAELGRCLAAGPSLPNVYVIRRSLLWKPLQGDPRFEALLNDPKNNAPLY